MDQKIGGSKVCFANQGRRVFPNFTSAHRRHRPSREIKTRWPWPIHRYPITSSLSVPPATDVRSSLSAIYCQFIP